MAKQKVIASAILAGVVAGIALASYLSTKQSGGALGKQIGQALTAPPTPQRLPQQGDVITQENDEKKANQ